MTSGTATSATPSWTYDADGNRQGQTGGTLPAYSASTVTLSYNNRNRLVSYAGATTTAFLYNALGQRVQKSGAGGTTLFMYDEAGHLLGEFTGSGALIEETAWLGDLPIATMRPHAGGGIDVYYVHADHLNTPKTVTRPSDNAIVWRWDQDPFGTVSANANPGGLGTFVYNLRYPGQYLDTETGLSYNYARDFDSGVGRFVESDPMGLTAGVNTYSYSRSDPVALIDPDGLCPAVIDTGQFVGTIWRGRCPGKGKGTHYEGQYRSQFVGTLTGQEGDCSCDQKSQVCIYSLLFYISERRTPCGGGPFSPWDDPVSGRPKTLRVPVDCKSGQMDLNGLTINGYHGRTGHGP